MTYSFCGKCGTRVVDTTDSFCRTCGASLVVSPDVGNPQPSYLPAQSAATEQTSAVALPFGNEAAWRIPKRPWWPLGLVAVGVLLATFFTFVALVSYGDMQAAEGLGIFGGEIPPSRIDAPIDAYGALPYAETRDALIASSVIAGLGFLLVVIGLVAAIVFQPKPLLVPSSLGAESQRPQPPVVRLGRLRVAAWLAFGGAALEIPMVVALQLNPSSSGLTVGLLTIGFGLSYVFCHGYALLWLKRLLNAAWAYRSADRILKWMIGLMLFVGGSEIVAGIIASLTPPSSSPPPSYDWWIFALLVPFAALYVGLGVKLLKAPGDLYGLKNALGYLIIADGFSTFIAAWPAGAVVAGVVTAAGGAVLGLVLLRGASSYGVDAKAASTTA